MAPQRQVEDAYRPDAGPGTGSTRRTGCDYDGGCRTEPFILLSAVLVAFG